MTPKDRIALAIVLGLITWGLVLMLGLTWRGKSLSEGGGEIFLAIATGLATSLGAYFATRNNGK
jgi:hypothetical protein